MSSPTDDQLAQFRMQSDRAFLEMQKNADKAMADFLHQYGGDVATASIFSPQTELKTHKVAPRANTSEYSMGPGPSVPKINLAGVNQAHLQDSVDDLKKDFGALSNSLRDEGKAAAQDALKGTSDILRGSAFNLGQKAKEEAAALKEAMKRALEEERSLKSLKGRASEEVKKAKERFKLKLEDSREEVMDDLEKMALGQFESLRDKAGDVLEKGQDSLQREWNDLSTGQDT